MRSTWTRWNSGWAIIPEKSQARKNKPYTVTGLRSCLEKGAKAFNWQASRAEAEKFNAENSHVKRGVGVASCLWIVGDGGPPSTVIVKLYKDGSVNLNMGASDIGTGTKTVMAQVAAEELGVHPSIIQIENADTATTQFATPSGGSKTVPTEAPTVRNAALALKRELLNMAAEDLEADVEDLIYVGDEISVRNKPLKKVNITEDQRTEETRRGDRSGLSRSQYRGQGNHSFCCPVL